MFMFKIVRIVYCTSKYGIKTQFLSEVRTKQILQDSAFRY